MTESQENFQITDNSSLHHYRTETPNIIWDLKLDPYSMTLYQYYKRIAGDRGRCIQKKNSISESTGMSASTIKDRNKILAQPQQLLNGKPLILVKERFHPNGEPDTTEISIIDIWPENFQIISSRFSGNRPRSPENRKEEEPIKNSKLAGSSSPLSDQCKNSESQSNLFPQKKAALENTGYPLTSDNIYNLSKNHTLQDIEKAVALLKTKKEEIKSPSSWISRCIREKWWETADQELITTTSLWDSFKTAISALQEKISFNMKLDVSKNEVSFSSTERAFIVLSSRFSTEDLTKQTLEVINKSFNEPYKLIYVNLGTPKIEVMQ